MNINVLHLIDLFLYFLMVDRLGFSGIGVVSIDGFTYYYVIYFCYVLESPILHFRCSSCHDSV